MNPKTATLIRQAAVHLDAPVLTSACETQILLAIRHRQERGRHHRIALMSACGAVAVVMLLYIQFRTDSSTVAPQQAVPVATSSVEPVSPPVAYALPSVVPDEEPDVTHSVEEAPKRDKAIPSKERAIRAPDVPKQKTDPERDDEPSVATPVKGVEAPPSVETLWGLVDHQRAGRHYSQAITTLEMLLSTYPKDSRAFLAAFTLARTLEAAGKDPRRIARFYERAYDLSPAGPLARDSLKRALTTMQKTAHTDEVERLNHRWNNAYGDDDAGTKGQSSQ